MCKQSTNTQTVVQNPTIPDWLSTSFQNLAGRAETASNQPFNPGVQKNVANFNSDQLSGFQTIRNSQGVYDPYMDAATGYAAIGGSPVSGQSIQNYMNPFTQNVIDSTMANINQNNTIQANNLRGNAALQGGLGNDRLGVAQAELARNQNLATNQTLANLQAQNYNQALGAAQQDRSAAQGAASQFSNLGGQLSNLMGQDASRLMTTGGLQQQLAQTQLDTTSANIAQQEQYPFATASWLGGMLQGASPSFTGTQSTTSTPGPSTLSQIAGLGLAGAGLFGLSDPRAKIDLGIVGELNDGTPVHAFKYKDDPNGQTHFGPMADDIARTNPEAVRNVDGMLYINPDMVAADQQNVMDAEYEDVSERDGYNTGGFTSYPGTHTVDKQAIVRMSQPQGQQTPMGTSNIVPAQSVQAGQMISAMSPVRDKVSRPKGMVEEAKGIADDLRPMMQAGKGFGALADQGMRTFGGFSMQRDKLGPPVPEGLADGGRVGYALGGMATGPYSSTGFNPTSPSLYGMPVPAPQPAARPVRAAGLGGQFSMPTQAPDVPAPAGMNEMETLAAANAAPQTAGWMTTVQPEMQTSPVGGQTPPAASGFGFGNMSEAARMGMIQAGLGMAAGTSPNALTNIGRGGMVGMQAYQAAKEAESRKAQEALQNRIAERKLELLNEQWKQQQAEYADNRPLREAQIAKARMDAMSPDEKSAAELRALENKVAAITGFAKGSPEHRQAMQQAAGFGAKSQTDDIKEYQFAVQQGYKGSYLDFQKEKKGATADKHTYREIDGKLYDMNNGVPRLVLDPSSANRAEQETNVMGGLEKLGQLPDKYKNEFDTSVGPIEAGTMVGRGVSSVRNWASKYSPSEVRSQIEADARTLLATVKPLIRKPGEGPLSDKDQAALDAIVGDLLNSNDAGDYKRRLAGVRDRLNANFGLKLGKLSFERSEGSKPNAAPEAPATPPATGAIVDGYKFKGGDPSKRENWERVQ